MNLICKICGNRDEHPTWTAKERMFGMGGEFLYFQCKHCSCLQIANIPEDLSHYYPSQYYSFGAYGIPVTGLKAKAAALRDRAAALGQRGPISSLLCKIDPPRVEVNSLAAAKPTLQSRILDVGCGSGQLLSTLYRAGFKNLSGIDPFLAADHEIVPGVYVRKKKLEEVDGMFDLIMLHHVFEHMPDGEEALFQCKRLLSTEGKILIRFPTPDSYAWKHYRDRWVQLDAPRHLFLYSRRSMEIMADCLSLQIQNWYCDSTEFQFWGSESYQKGISLTKNSPSVGFTQKEMKAFCMQAQKLNRSGTGDQVVAVLVLK